MIRTKVCGITRVEDAVAAATVGFDAIGLVFVEASKRFVTSARAAEICAALPPLVGRVGLFMDAHPDDVAATLERVPLNWLQFHGSESQAYCLQFGRPWIKAIAMGESQGQQAGAFDKADAVLLDAHASGELGGSGKIFDWSQVPAMERPWVLAGGLNPGNIGQACRQLKPPAVDVSSGVEIRPGIKDVKLMEEFIKVVKNG